MWSVNQQTTMTARAALFVFFLVAVSANAETTLVKIARNILDRCLRSDNFVKCMKIQGLKIADRALHLDNFTLFDGVKVTSRSFNADKPPLSYEKLYQLPSESINDLIYYTAVKFLETHRLQLDPPVILEEGRGKMKKYMGPFMAALAIKGSFMAMAYKSIAVMAGTALIIGKIALLLSAILGLKKLISSSAQEKTTFEIVKQPDHSGYADDGHYHRSLTEEEEMMMQDKVYRGYRNYRREGFVY